MMVVWQSFLAMDTLKTNYRSTTTPPRRRRRRTGNAMEDCEGTRARATQGASWLP